RGVEAVELRHARGKVGRIGAAMGGDVLARDADKVRADGRDAPDARAGDDDLLALLGGDLVSGAVGRRLRKPRRGKAERRRGERSAEQRGLLGGFPISHLVLPCRRFVRSSTGASQPGASWFIYLVLNELERSSSFIHG